MVPPDAFSTAAPQSSSAFCSGCDAGTQCDSFSSKVLSCANAGVTPAASSKANNVFLIDSVSLYKHQGFNGPLRALLYDIIVLARTCGDLRCGYAQAYNNQGSKYCGQKWQSLARGRRGCCWDSCFTATGSTTSSLNARPRTMCSAASAQGFWKRER